MRGIFEKAISEASRFRRLSGEEVKALEDVDSACEELVESEFENYVARRYNEEIPKVMSRYSVMGLPIDPKYGGRGLGIFPHALAMERFGQLSLGVATFVDVHQFLGSLTVQEWGSEEIKSNVLPLFSSGEAIAAYALTEPEAGSDPASMKTSYRKQNGRYRIRGEKYLISNGSLASHIVVFARNEDEKSSITAFLVETKNTGFNVDMRLTEKPGLFTSDTALLSFDDLEVDGSAILGQEGKGLHVAYSALLNGRIGIASACLGVMEDCLEQVTERVKSRYQHGKEIGKHQLVQKHIAKIATNLEASRWLVLVSALKKEEYDRDRKDLAKRNEADKYSAIAKYTASRYAFEAADSSLQLFGGFGYNIMSPVTKHFLDTRVARIYEGTDEIMELKIASTILGKDYEAYR
ncbi:MAG: acyl-CoA dehydrogenase family protein [Conexivisphaerales archaeon]